MSQCKCGGYAINDDPAGLLCDRCWRDEEITRLKSKLDSAVELLRAPGRITLGYRENKPGYFLDDRYAGPTLDDVVAMAAAAAGGEE